MASSLRTGLRAIHKAVVVAAIFAGLILLTLLAPLALAASLLIVRNSNKTRDSSSRNGDRSRRPKSR